MLIYVLYKNSDGIKTRTKLTGKKTKKIKKNLKKWEFFHSFHPVTTEIIFQTCRILYPVEVSLKISWKTIKVQRKHSLHGFRNSNFQKTRKKIKT